MTVLASGSRGNCTVVTAGRTTVLVDAGVSCREILKRMQMAGEDPAQLDAILVTHEHQDHVQGLSVLARRLGIPVFFTEATHRAWMRWMQPQRRMTYAEWLAARKADAAAKAAEAERAGVSARAEVANPFYREAGLAECAEEQAELAREQARLQDGAHSGTLRESGASLLGATTQEAGGIARQGERLDREGSRHGGACAAAVATGVASAQPAAATVGAEPTRSAVPSEVGPAPGGGRLGVDAPGESSGVEAAGCEPVADPCALPAVEHFRAGKGFSIGDLTITAFTIPHDAADPVGFVLEGEGVRVGLATDLGYMPANVAQQLRGCDVVMLESNHDLDMLRDGPYPWSVKQRVLSRVGHLSNAAAAEFLEKGYDGQAAYVVLAHLSESNNLPELARVAAEWALRDRMKLLANKLVVAAQHVPTEPIRL